MLLVLGWNTLQNIKHLNILNQSGKISFATVPFLLLELLAPEDGNTNKVIKDIGLNQNLLLYTRKVSACCN